MEVFQCVPPPADREAFSFSFRVVRAVRVVRAKLCVRVSVSGPKGRVPGGGADTRAAPRVTATLSCVFRFFVSCPPCLGDPCRTQVRVHNRVPLAFLRPLSSENRGFCVSNFACPFAFLRPLSSENRAFFVSRNPFFRFFATPLVCFSFF